MGLLVDTTLIVARVGAHECFIRAALKRSAHAARNRALANSKAFHVARPPTPPWTKLAALDMLLRTLVALDVAAVFTIHSIALEHRVGNVVLDTTAKGRAHAVRHCARAELKTESVAGREWLPRAHRARVGRALLSRRLPLQAFSTFFIDTVSVVERVGALRESFAVLVWATVECRTHAARHGAPCRLHAIFVTGAP